MYALNNQDKRIQKSEKSYTIDKFLKQDFRSYKRLLLGIQDEDGTESTLA